MPNRCVPITAKLASWRWQRYCDYRHARGLAHVQVTAPEAARVAARLPLAFVARDESYVLSALLALTPGENHCLSADDSWNAGYVPACLRSPPFRLMPTPGGKPGSRTLAIEPESPWCHEEGEEYLVDESGRLSESVAEVFAFLSQYEKHRLATQRAVDSLIAHDLLAPWKVALPGESPLPDVFRLDEKRWNSLGDDALVHLRKMGALPLVYAHFVSTFQLENLQMMARRGVDCSVGKENPCTQLDIEKMLNEEETLGLEFDD